MRYAAEAKGIQQLLDSKSEGYQALVKSCNGDAKAAATFMLLEKLQDIVHLQVEAISNLKIEKVTVWDSGNGESTAGFFANMVKSLPPLHDIARLAGLELPDYLGNMAGGSDPDGSGKKGGGGGQGGAGPAAGGGSAPRPQQPPQNRPPAGATSGMKYSQQETQPPAQEKKAATREKITPPPLDGPPPWLEPDPRS
jgi:flotillin